MYFTPSGTFTAPFQQYNFSKKEKKSKTVWKKGTLGISSTTSKWSWIRVTFKWSLAVII